QRRALRVKVTRQSTSPSEVILNIQLDSEDEEPFIARSYRRVVNRMQIPGFRRGKAPRSIVERFVGRTALAHEALDFLIPETLDRVLKEENLEVFAQPDVELLEIEPVSFKAVVPLEPVVDLGDYRHIRLEREPVEITDAQVDEVIERLRYEAGPWEPVSRPVQFGDLLRQDVGATIDGKRAVDDRGIDFIPQSGNTMPFPGFSPQLEGMAEQQEKAFTLTMPPDYPQRQYAGKECHFRVKVLSIKEKKLPELDDEFAKGVGEGYDSLADLRAQVRQRLTQQEEAAALRRLEEGSLEQLLQTASVQASGLIFERELNLMREERERALRSQRMDMETYLRLVGKTEEELLEEIRPQARERMTRYLVLRKLAQEEGIEVTPEEVQVEMDTLVSGSGDSQEAVRRALSSENARESLRMGVLNRKVLGRLVEIAQPPAVETVKSEESLSPAAPAPAQIPSPERT
ncbi:MAG: trigger factor, partial [Chloroflexota bacterium]